MPLEPVSALSLLRTYSREPFRKVLAQWLENPPTTADIQALAKKSPDRWGQGVQMLGKLSGYSERTELDVTGQIEHVHTLSDLELEARLAQIQQQLEAMPKRPALSPHDGPDAKQASA